MNINFLYDDKIYMNLDLMLSFGNFYTKIQKKSNKNNEFLLILL